MSDDHKPQCQFCGSPNHIGYKQADALCFAYLKQQLTAALDSRKTAEQSLDEITRDWQTEIVALRQAEQRAEDAEKACALLRQEVFETRCFDLKGACSAGGHGKRDAEIVAIVNERLDAEIQSAGRDYVHKSKLDEAIKALGGLLEYTREHLAEHLAMYGENYPHLVREQDKMREAIAAAEEVTKGNQ